MTDSQPARGCELPCPFCGSAAVLMDSAVGRMFCMACLAQGPRDVPWNTRVAGGGGVSDAMVERLTIRFFNQTLGIPSWSKTKEGDRQMALQSMRELIGELVAALQVKP